MGVLEVVPVLVLWCGVCFGWETLLFVWKLVRFCCNIKWRRYDDLAVTFNDAAPCWGWWLWAGGGLYEPGLWSLFQSGNPNFVEHDESCSRDPGLDLVLQMEAPSKHCTNRVLLFAAKCSNAGDQRRACEACRSRWMTLDIWSSNSSPSLPPDPKFCA